MEQVKSLLPMDDPDAKLGFVRQTLQALKSEIGSSAALLGFIGEAGQGTVMLAAGGQAGRGRPAQNTWLCECWQARQPASLPTLPQLSFHSTQATMHVCAAVSVPPNLAAQHSALCRHPLDAGCILHRGQG